MLPVLRVAAARSDADAVLQPWVARSVALARDRLATALHETREVALAR